MRKICWLSIVTLISLSASGQSSIVVIGDLSEINCIDFSPGLYIQDSLNNSTGNHFLNFDLNGDATADLQLNVTAFTAPMSASTGTAELTVLNVNLELACDTYYYAWPDTLSVGDTLKKDMPANVWTSKLQWPEYPFSLRYVINGNGGLGGTGLWQHGNPYYMGFRFITDSDTLYGYFRMTVMVSAGTAEIWVNEVCYQGTVNWLTSISNVSSSPTDISFFPNPVNSVFQINSHLPGNYNGRLTELSGKVRSNFSFTSAYQLNIAGFPSGVYLLSVYNNDSKEMATFRFVKE